MIYKRQRKFFSEAYKTGEHGWPAEIPTRTVVRFLKEIKIEKPEGEVLDIGCGEGRHTIFFAENGYDAYGFDMELLAIKSAKRFAKIKGIKKNIHLFIGNILSLPFSHNIFDIAIDYGCLHHIKKSDLKIYIENVSMVLKEGSFFVLSVFSTKFKHYDHFFTKKDIRQLFKKAFNVLKVEEEKSGLHVFYHCLMQVKTDR
ncbi:MAG: hypothetical protein A2Z59_07430 [Nitrospinae bacterium RIFCSPLOWO2_02_39_17]|nr:MAG: hypothetical protein A2Z59_07430 [Nitrospinae bacterium RIFCSPLOWO2_02_39_17]